MTSERLFKRRSRHRRPGRPRWTRTARHAAPGRPRWTKGPTLRSRIRGAVRSRLAADPLPSAFDVWPELFGGKACRNPLPGTGGYRSISQAPVCGPVIHLCARDAMVNLAEPYEGSEAC